MSDHIKQRIIALLRLAKDGSNKNEASAAKRQAENLMRRYNLKEKDLHTPTPERQAYQELENLIQLIKIRSDLEKKQREYELRMKKLIITRVSMISFILFYIVMVVALLIHSAK